MFFFKRPELYEFSVTGKQWRFTSSDVAVQYDSAEYSPLQMVRTKIVDSQSSKRSDVTIDMPRDSEIPELFRASPPSEPIKLTIYRKHRLSDTYGVIFTGVALNCKWNGATAVVTASNRLISLRRTGLRRVYQPACPHVLFGNHCRIGEASFETVGSVADVSGVNLIVPEAAGRGSNYYAGGWVSWNRSGSLFREARSIVSSDNNGGIVLQLRPVDLSVGDSLKLYPGCDKSFEACKSKFDNGNNFGGFPHIPEVPPFGGTSIF